MTQKKSIGRIVMLGTGAGLLVLGSSHSAWAFDTQVIDWAIGELCGHITGHLGGLLTTVAAVGALIAAAMGSYRVFYGAIITAVGAFAISAIMSLYFPEASSVCSKAGGAGAGTGGGGGAPQGGNPGGGDNAPGDLFGANEP